MELLTIFPRTQPDIFFEAFGKLRRGMETAAHGYILHRQSGTAQKPPGKRQAVDHDKGLRSAVVFPDETALEGTDAHSARHGQFGKGIMPGRKTRDFLADILERFRNIPSETLLPDFGKEDEGFRSRQQRRPFILLLQQTECPFEALLQQFRGPRMQYL